MTRIKGAGLLALTPSPMKTRIVVELLDTISIPLRIITRRLTHRRRGDDVRFRDERAALAQIQGIILSGGALPHQWIWDPYAEFGKDAWVPLRLTPFEAEEGRIAFQFRAWEIVSWSGEWVVRRCGRGFGKANGSSPSRFATLESAKQFCEEQERCLGAASGNG
jgi:hypothetical protein